MRLPTIRAACGAALSPLLGLAVSVAGLAACGSSDNPAKSTAKPSDIPVYVLNFHGAEQGRADQRPSDLVVSEFSTLNRITWQRWGPTKAVGVGKLVGTWCLPACAAAPYDATVTLSVVVPVRGAGYFTRYAITAELPDDYRDRADLTGGIQTP